MIEFTNSGRAKTNICDYCLSFSCEGNTVTIINDEFLCEECLVKPMSHDELRKEVEKDA